MKRTDESRIWTSPLEMEHGFLYAEMRERSGFMLPWTYSTAHEERALVEKGTVLCDLSATGKLRLVGRAVDPVLYGMLDGDFDILATIGAGMTAALDQDICSEGFVDEPSPRLLVLRTGEHEFMMLTRYDQTSRLHDLLRDYVECGENEDELEEGEIFLSDETDHLAMLCLSGKDAVPVLAEMGQGADDEARAEIAGMGEYTLGMSRLDTAPVLLLHGTAMSYYLLTPPAHARGLWRGLLSFEQISPVGYDVFELLDLLN